MSEGGGRRTGERWIGVFVDPDVPDDVADVLRGNEALVSRVRAGWVPESELPIDRGPRHSLRTRLAVAGAGSSVLLVLLFARVINRIDFVLLCGFVLGIFLFMGIGGGLREEEEEEDPLGRLVYKHAHRYERQYLLSEDFDEASGALLARARRAVDSVLRSRVNYEGLLDDTRNGVVLSAQEWGVARSLAKLSSLRAEHREIVGADAAKEVSEAVRPLEAALAASETAVAVRVEALERYSRHVEEAERAHKARDQIEALRERLPRYEDLLAEVDADRLALPEVTALTDDAQRLERAYKDSMRSAHEVFRYLEGPAAPDRYGHPI